MRDNRNLIEGYGMLAALDQMLLSISPVSETDGTLTKLVDAIRDQITAVEDIITLELEDCAEKGEATMAPGGTDLFVVRDGLQAELYKRFASARKNMKREKEGDSREYWVGYWTGYASGIRDLGAGYLGIDARNFRDDGKRH